MEKRRGRGDGSESNESPDMADAFDHSSTAQRSDYDTGPETCADRADLSWRKPLDPTTDAKQRPLKSITHLHQAETQQQSEQSRQGRLGRTLHRCSSPRYVTFTGDGVTFQIRSQYSRMERSEENFSMRETLRIDLRVQATGSTQRALTAF